MAAAAMELTMDNGSVLRAPTEAQLKATIDTLGTPDNGYAILAAGEQHYLQVSGSPSEGYVAEYREGSEASHHSSVSAALTHAQVQALMSAYLSGGFWKSMTAWERGMGGARSGARARPVASRRSAGSLPILFLLVFLTVGLGATAMAVYFVADSLRFHQQAVSVPGKVVQLLGRDNDVKNAVVEYIDATGEPRRLQSSWASRPPAFHIGERVRVLHDAHDPRNARIDCFGDLWGRSAFAAIFAVAFNGVAMAVLLTRRRRQRRSS